MDIFTHVLIGATATSPWWTTHPLESVAFTLGSILPDIDAVSRQQGKVAFLRAHQTWTHAIPVHIGLTLGAALALVAGELPILVPSVLALGAGAILHSLLDWTNTYGVRLWAPFDRARKCGEWVFFIDAPTILLCLVTLGVQAYLQHNQGATSTLLGNLAVGVGTLYFLLRGQLRRRTQQRRPACTAIIPSAGWPWRYYCMEREEDAVVTYRYDVLTHQLDQYERHDVFDSDWPKAVALPEYAAMRDLSGGFAIVAATPERLVCRDLRTRNTFGTDFGRLVVTINEGILSVEKFDV